MGHPKRQNSRVKVKARSSIPKASSKWNGTVLEVGRVADCLSRADQYVLITLRSPWPSLSLGTASFQTGQLLRGLSRVLWDV